MNYANLDNYSLRVTKDADGNEYDFNFPSGFILEPGKVFMVVKSSTPDLLTESMPFPGAPMYSSCDHWDHCEDWSSLTYMDGDGRVELLANGVIILRNKLCFDIAFNPIPSSKPNVANV